MSEKRFGYGETDLFEWVEDNGKMISTKECVNKLNEQQDKITELEVEWTDCKNRKEQSEYNLQKRVDEQQATIDMQELRLQQLEELLELSENLNKSYREKLIDMILNGDKDE